MSDFLEVRTKRKGEALRHPCGAIADNAGGSWPRDQFTARRLRDDDIEEVVEQKLAGPGKSGDKAGKAGEAE